MSLSEVFDHGAAIPWANMRFNNLTLDGNESKVIAQNGPISGGTTEARGSLRVQNTVNNLVYVYNLPNMPLNGAVLFKFTIIAKGGPPGLTNNALSREVWYLYQVTNNVVTNFQNMLNVVAPLGFAVLSITQTVTNIGNAVQFQVANLAPGQTTDFMWFITSYALNTTL